MSKELQKIKDRLNMGPVILTLRVFTPGGLQITGIRKKK